MKPFRDRNPVTIGAISVTVIVLGVLTAFQLDTITGWFGTKYRAAFADASGLRPSDEVRIAGVKVGKVTDVELAGFDSGSGKQDPYVEVTFRVNGDVELGKQTRALIAIKTIVRQKFLALEPAGPGEMGSNDLIPRSRTASPFDVVDAFSGLADTVSKVDVKQLAEALGVLSDTFEKTPPHVKSSLKGLSRLSRAVADRDAQLRLLLKRTRGVTKVLADRREEFRKLVKDGNLLLEEVSNRREAIHNLLIGTDDLAQQLSGLATDNREQLKPALRELRGVVEILRKNKSNLETILKRMSPFLRAFTNVVGNGRWFDNYIDGFIQPFTPGAPGLGVKGGSRPNSLWSTGG
jgi:phospholipid/cholesterol/gamma-HCH transport system substrate-binding protein